LGESGSGLNLLDMCLSNIKIISVNQSPVSSEVVAATDDPFVAENPAEISEFETDWEENGDIRERIFREILSSYPAWQSSNAQIRQRRNRRLLDEPQKQKLIDDLMRGFYTIFNRVSEKHRTCVGGQASSSQCTAQLTSASNVGSSTQATNIKRKVVDFDEFPEGDDGDHPPKRYKSLHKRSDDRLPDLKFACPFHQHNPQKYSLSLYSSDADYRSCIGPGWRSVARIK
jgi:hypothetical protein